MPHYDWQQHHLILRCHLQPNASNSEFAGLHNGRLKIRIAAAPVDGKANKALINFLSESFGVAKAQIEITHGLSGREKIVKILEPTRLPEASAVKASAD